MDQKFDLAKRLSDRRLREFSNVLIEMQRQMGFKLSSRGLAYQMEGFRWINKDQFDRVEEAVNTARKRGYLPVDFVAEETARSFSGIEKPSTGEPEDVAPRFLNGILEGWRYFTPDWWEGERYYIQVVVEKIDLKTLFEPICHKYHIPIANSKGWSSLLQRAEYARRYKMAQEAGLKCVLLYCGDHDPDGWRISDTIMSNLNDLKHIRWSDGLEGYDPKDLIIDRFGLNYDFIKLHNLTWIDNLITGSGKDLNDPKHPNYDLPYLVDYKKRIGVRKCEANAIVIIPDKARELMETVITTYLGTDAPERFAAKTRAIKEKYDAFLESSGLKTSVINALAQFDGRNDIYEEPNDEDDEY